MSAEAQKVGRRPFIKYLGIVIVTAAVVGGGIAAYYASLPPAVKVVEKPVEKVVKETLKETVTVAGSPTVVEKTIEKIVTQTVPPPKPPAREKVTLRMIHMTSTYPEVKITNDTLIRQWNARVPDTQIVVDVSSWGEVLEKVSKAHAAGKPYDVIETSTEPHAAGQAEGLYAPVTEIYKELGGDKHWDPNFAKMTYWKGEYWALNEEGGPLHQPYRKDWFDARGFKEPKNWDQYLEIAKSFTEDTDKDGKIDRWGCVIPLRSDYFLQSWTWSCLMGNGGRLVDEKGKVALDSPETIEFYEWLKEMWKYTPPGSADYGAGELRMPFVENKVATTWYSRTIVASDIDKFNKDLYGKVDIFLPPPSGRAGHNEPKARFVADMMTLSSGTKYPDRAKEFLKWYFEVSQIYMFMLIQQQMGMVPAVLPAREDPEFWKDPILKRWEAIFKKHADFMKYAVPATMENPGVVNPATATILGKLLLQNCNQDILVRNIPIKEAVKKWADEMRKVTGEIK